MTTPIEKIGRVSAHPRGFGFAETENGERYFIPPASMKRLITHDRITFTVEPGRLPGEFQVGEIIHLERAPRILLGELEVHQDHVFLVCDEPCFVSIDVSETAIDADMAPGDVVAVRIPESREASRFVRGELVSVLGSRTRAGFDCDYALLKFGLSQDVSEKAFRQAQSLEADVLLRLSCGWADLRGLPLVTIDGESTRDLDDAVSARLCAEGFEVSVAIADVSAYVQPASALEAQAFDRCTSVYLPGRTVPMLPEALSAELGSLKADVPRLALVCRIVVDRNGAILSSRFERGVIVSRARLTYSQVYARMQTGAPVSAQAQVEHSLDVLEKLYHVLAQARRERGALEFNDREAKLGVRPDGEFELHWEERNDAHRLIEEVMLLANRAAAETLSRRGALAFYRHQAQPLEEDLEELREWLASQEIALPAAPTVLELSELLASVKDRPDHAVIEARIRSVMQLAVYDNLNPAHFSLGYSAYTHFTSPLRRYSDLLVHRLLLGDAVSEDQLKQAAERCSAKARAARAAERFVWDRIKKRVLVRDVPQEQALACRVLHGSRRGLKVLINDWQCATFIPEESLAEAGYHWEDARAAWRNGQPLEPGHSLSVSWRRLIEEKGSCELIADLK